MKFVEIYKLQDDGSQQRVIICELVGDKAICTGEDYLVKTLEKDGILDKSKIPSKALFPKDGLAFLEKLKFVFKSAYLNASDIMEK